MRRWTMRGLGAVVAGALVVCALGCADLMRPVQKQLMPTETERAEKKAQKQEAQAERADAAADALKPLPSPAGTFVVGVVPGVAIERLTQTGEDERWPTLSPLGDELLVTRVRPAPDAKKPEDQLVRLFGLDPRTGDERHAYSRANIYASQGRWAADGQGFVFVSDAIGPMSLVRTTARAKEAPIKLIVDDRLAIGVSDPAPSPDNTRVAFTTHIRNVKHVAVTRLDGSDFTIITEGGAPAWSPDGKRLAFHREVKGHYQVFTVDAQTGTGLTQLTDAPRDHFRPSWSPDGAQLVVGVATSETQHNANPQQERADLALLHAATRQITPITRSAYELGSPCWGKDGWIYFEARLGDQYDILRLRPTPNTTASPAPQTTPAQPQAVQPDTQPPARPQPTQPAQPQPATPRGLTEM